MLSTEELNSLIFYQGDVNNYVANTIEEKIKYSKNFYKTKVAYHVLNMLLYPGMDNEITRICNEKKSIPIDLLYSIEEIFNVYNNIFSSMCKYSLSKTRVEKVIAFRKDRIQTLDVLAHGYTPSFLSCSLEDSCDDYFFKKDGILLLELDFCNHIPHIVLNDVISNSTFEYQKEVLLPPFITLKKTPLELTEKEKKYRDINQLQPKAKFSIKLDGMMFEKDFALNIDYSLEKILKDTEQIMEILYKLSYTNKIIENDKIFYTKWKRAVQGFVYQMFKNTYTKAYLK